MNIMALWQYGSIRSRCPRKARQVISSMAVKRPDCSEAPCAESGLGVNAQSCTHSGQHAWSAAPRRFDGRNVDIPHAHHRFEGAPGDGGIGIRDRFGERARRDLLGGGVELRRVQGRAVEPETNRVLADHLMPRGRVNDSELRTSIPSVPQRSIAAQVSPRPSSSVTGAAASSSSVTSSRQATLTAT